MTPGYVTNLEYTHGHYRELGPGLLRLACLSAGLVSPPAAPLSYLELGYGHGLSINIHAAAGPGEFWGTDFNPAQAANAQALATASGSGARLLDDSFAELAARPDLPDFDIITMHGIWAWVSEENRRVIADLIRRKLRVGGLVYVSYNCLPGSISALPFRHLMSLHASRAGGAPLSKVDGALGFVQQVAAHGMYFQDNPPVLQRLARIMGEDRRYLAHEYFNSDWAVLSISDVAQSLEAAKVGFATSAYLLDHLEGLNVTGGGLAMLGGIDDPILREVTRDYLTGRQFRKDIFIKGSQRLSPIEQVEALRSQAVVMVAAPEDVPLVVSVPAGQVTLQEAVYRPVIEALAVATPQQLADVFGHVAPLVSWQQFVEVVTVLAGAGYVDPVQETTPQARQRCAALNRHLCERARGKPEFEFLASPVTGSGVHVERIHQLFLLAAQHGRQSPADQATYVADLLTSQGERILKDGKAAETVEDHLAEIAARAVTFAEKRMPILKALEIC